MNTPPTTTDTNATRHYAQWTAVTAAAEARDATAPTPPPPPIEHLITPCAYCAEPANLVHTHTHNKREHTEPVCATCAADSKGLEFMTAVDVLSAVAVGELRQLTQDDAVDFLGV